MKLTAIIKSLSLPLLLLCLASCDDDNNSDLIIDYTPVNLYIEVYNANGENLLDPATPGNILDEDNYIYCDNKRFVIEERDPYGPEYYDPDYFMTTRAILPMWYGAIITKAYKTDEPIISIGEFDGGWNGTANVLLVLGSHSYELSFNSKINGLDVKRKFYLDGKKQDSNIFKIII